MALTDSLISYWELEESSGTRNDSHGSNHLTDNNSVGVATGKVGNAGDFESSSSQFLSLATNASLNIGDIDFTVAAWANLESSVLGYIICKFQSGFSDEYSLYYNNGTSRFEFTFFNISPIKADNLGAPSLSTWYFVIAWHDATADTINIQVNDGTVDSKSDSTSLTASASTFRIGSAGVGGSYFDGLLDQVGFWKRVLTSGERTSLYNSGSGLSYAGLSGGGGGGAAQNLMTLLGCGQFHSHDDDYERRDNGLYVPKWY